MRHARTQIELAAIALTLFGCGGGGNRPPITPSALGPLTTIQQVPSAVQAQVPDASKQQAAGASASSSRPTWEQCTDQCFIKGCLPAGDEKCRVENAPAICAASGGACTDVWGYWLLPNGAKQTIYLSDVSRGVNPASMQQTANIQAKLDGYYGYQGARGSYFNRSLDRNLYSHLNVMQLGGGGAFPYRSQSFRGNAGFNQPICNGGPSPTCPNLVDQGMFAFGGAGVSCADDVMYYTFENPNQAEAQKAYYRLGAVVQQQGSSTMKAQYKAMGTQLMERFKYMPLNIGYSLANGALGLADTAASGIMFQTNQLANGLVGMGAAFQTTRYMPPNFSCNGSSGGALPAEVQCACYTQCQWIQ